MDAGNGCGRWPARLLPARLTGATNERCDRAAAGPAHVLLLFRRIGLPRSLGWHGGEAQGPSGKVSPMPRHNGSAGAARARRRAGLSEAFSEGRLCGPVERSSIASRPVRGDGSGMRWPDEQRLNLLVQPPLNGPVSTLGHWLSGQPGGVGWRAGGTAAEQASAEIAGGRQKRKRAATRAPAGCSVRWGRDRPRWNGARRPAKQHGQSA